EIFHYYYVCKQVSHKDRCSFPTRRSSDLKHSRASMKNWSVNLATWIGLSSILIWASLVAVVKLITESTSAVQGIALIYSFSSLRSEEHTSELQSRENLVCRLLLEKKKRHR